MSELYNLPDEWEWKKLGDLTTTTSGGTPKRNEKLYWGGNIGWLKSGELNDGYITNVEEYITDEGLTKSSAKLFPKGTLLIAMYGATVGKLGILEIETTTNQAICGILNDKNKFETLFMFYYLKKIREKMIEDSFGGAQPNLSQTYIKDLDIPLPPLEEQKRIVAKLDNLFAKIDKAITLHQKNIDEADIFMASVLNDVFIELEEKYRKDLLSNYCQITSSKRVYKADYVDNGVLFYRIKDIVLMSKNLPITDSQYIKRETFNEFDKKFGSPRSGDILLTAVGATLGYTYLVTDKDGEFYFKDGNLLWLKDIKDLDGKYLLKIFKSPLFGSYLDEISKGAAQPAITIIKLKEFNIPIPPLQTQQKVVVYLDEISKKMEKIKQIQKEKMQSLKALKASILDQAFKGEL